MNRTGAESSNTAPGATEPAAGDRGPTIFVSIPSYRDPECQYTVLDLFRKARCPRRVFVGICWQADRGEDSRCFLLDLGEYEAQIRTTFLHHSRARGPCYARALIQRELFRGEDYVLQLDSHYRMVEGWDEGLLAELGRCPGEKPILTTYPSSYTLPDDYAPGGPDVAELHPDPRPVVVCAREFGPADGFLRTTGKACRAERLGGSPTPALFWAAGFAFSASGVVREVPYDPGLEDLFFGEEPLMAARLWTAGWDFFAPAVVYGYHLWTRKHRPVFREHACAEQKQREAASQKRARELLLGVAGPAGSSGADDKPDPYSMGTRRTLSAFEEFCGVSFATSRISERARRGGLDPSAFVNGDPAASSSPAHQAGGGPATPGPQILGLMPSQVAGKIAALLGGAAGAAEAVPAPRPPAAPPKLLHLGGRQGAGGLRLLRAAEVDAISRHGIVVLDRFLQDRAYPADGRPTPANPATIVHAGALQVPVQPARLGRGEQVWSSSIVRGDSMAWLSAPEGEGVSEHATQRVHRGPAGGLPCQPEAEPGAADSRGEARHDAGASTEADSPLPRAQDTRRSADASEGREGAPECSVRTSSTADAAAATVAARDAPFYRDLDVLLAKLVELRNELDGTLGFGSTRVSIMLAHYPGGGAHYARHRDALPEHRGKGRRLTAVYYLNPAWAPADGGCLRAYFPEPVGRLVHGAHPAGEGAAEWVLDIEPRLDRLVIFAS
eukprot:CAMPEP_0179215976 /NCGR_PEP_ID=MMETSP0797-20121207/3139_1 /TAXON_ID=47934 /ORGANISM="Dinophysis acuminata, Strain DAEP01" /LENGTH=726 /DNA_ID=CAMNT_0020922117 /DNA_START=5 /DNA_END=2182 /DNA_ORIENTATION=-